MAIKVMCSHSKMVGIDTLKPHPRNPNTHPEAQIKLLANIIAKGGFRSPIVVSSLSGCIVKGHGRLAAARLLGMKKVPVDVQEYADEASEMADLLADNRIAELAEWDRATLKDVLEDLDTGDFDMLLTGFDKDAIEALMTAVPPLELPPEPLPPSDMQGDAFDSGRVIITYTDEDQRVEIQRRLGVTEDKVIYAAADIIGGNT